MLDTQESINFFGNLRKSLSEKRFSGYLGRGTPLDAFAKYLWNTHICESLYPCFQLLEVAFRNKPHSQIGSAITEPNWILAGHRIFYQEEQEAIIKAKESLTLARCPMTEDYLISEMKFGFWTSLLNARYERLWPKIIADVLPNMPKVARTRADVSTLMNGVRRLRNASLHHHSIWHWNDLKDRHKQMRQLIDYICTPSATIAEQIDRFPVVYSSGMAECQKMASKILKSVQKPEALNNTRQAKH
jgi:hypothetical protein